MHTDCTWIGKRTQNEEFRVERLSDYVAGQHINGFGELYMMLYLSATDLQGHEPPVHSNRFLLKDGFL